MKSKFYCFILIFAFSLSSVFAQNDQKAPATEELPNPFEVAGKYVKQNNYLTPIFELKAREEKYLASPQWKIAYLEMMILLHGYVGNYDEAYAYENLFIEATPSYQRVRQMFAEEIAASPLAGHKMLDAVEAIASIADREQVIMVNEEHRTPFHRALTHQLLDKLYAKGFRYFAVETLYASDTELGKRGFPTQSTGFYTADPVFADAVRAALKIGFKLVPYENIDPNCKPTEDNPEFCQDKREREQAQHIYERILKNDPQAKILVHVGRGHNSKSGDEKFSFMAKHFRALTKIDPFTVDQVRYSERRNAAYEHPLYRYLTKNDLLREPTAFQAADGSFYRHSEGYDLTVFHPRMLRENGRAAFLKMNGARRAEKIDLKKLGLKRGDRNLFAAGEPVLIQAFYAGESLDAVPLDQIVLYPQKEVPVLMLTKGDFRVRAMDKSGKVLAQYEKTVK